jgi:DNA-binding response OmpR family regulator
MNKPTLLIVEPDILVRHPLAEYLRECGFLVLEAGENKQARPCFGHPDLKIDLVLIDVDAPDEGGFTLAKWIRAEHPMVKVLLAGTLENAATKAAEICEEHPDVAKPYDHQLVLERIRRLIAARDRHE